VDKRRGRTELAAWESALRGPPRVHRPLRNEVFDA